MEEIQNPKLKVSYVIKKFLILFDIKLAEDTPVYYAWKKRQPKWIITEQNTLTPKKSYLTVDYDKISREWYIGYIIELSNL